MESWEETGLKIETTALFGFYLDRYDDYHTLNIYFLAEVTGGHPHPGDDAADPAWFHLDALPSQIAFSHTPHVLADLAQQNSHTARAA